MRHLDDQRVQLEEPDVIERLAERRHGAGSETDDANLERLGGVAPRVLADRDFDAAAWRVVRPRFAPELGRHEELHAVDDAAVPELALHACRRAFVEDAQDAVEAAR